MKKQTCNVFYKDEIDNRTKVICVFNADASDEDMTEIISKYLEDEIDENEYSPIQSKKDCDTYAQNIVNGEMLDLDFDRYWIEKDVTLFA